MRKAASQIGFDITNAGEPRCASKAFISASVGSAWRLVVLGLPEVADDPPAVADDREEGEDAVAMPEDMQPVFRLETGDMAVGQGPVALERRAFEGEVQAVTHGRMGAVTPH
jgi:hypothetical protein